MLTPSGRGRSGTRASTSSTSRSTISTSATTRRAAFPGSTRRSSRAVPRDARARHRQHPLQHRHQERQPRPAPADRARAPRSSACGVNFSVYTDAKNGNRDYLVGARRARAARRRRSRELLEFKRRQRGVITNSDYYLEQIPRYLRGEMHRAVPAPAFARSTSIPTGHVKRCPDFPTDFHWRDFTRYEPDRLQRVLLRVPRRGAGAAAVVARSRRDGHGRT